MQNVLGQGVLLHRSILLEQHTSTTAASDEDIASVQTGTKNLPI